MQKAGDWPPPATPRDRPARGAPQAIIMAMYAIRYAAYTRYSSAPLNFFKKLSDRQCVCDSAAWAEAEEDVLLVLWPRPPTEAHWLRPGN